MAGEPACCGAPCGGVRWQPDGLPSCAAVRSSAPWWRPLPRLQPWVYKFSPTVQHSGFEGFTIKFAWGEPLLVGLAGGHNGAGACSPPHCLCAQARMRAWIACMCASPRIPRPEAHAWRANEVPCSRRLRTLRGCGSLADVYPEHLVSKGYNGILLIDAANCWVRNVSAGIRCTGAALPASSCCAACSPALHRPSYLCISGPPPSMPTYAPLSRIHL